MRRHFKGLLFDAMKDNANIFLLVGDLGYGVWDEHFKAYPDRCINVGASEQALIGIAVGLAQAGKIPFCYSIPNFLIYRPFETIRNYLQFEKANVKLIGSGRDKDYAHDGISHQSEDLKQVLDVMPNIVQLFPEKEEELSTMLNEMLINNMPTYLSLRR